MMDEPADNPAASRRGTWFTVAIVLLPIFYVLLLGPAVRLHRISPRPIKEMLELVYAPLEWADNRIPGNPFSEYVELWEP